ncbi:MAG: hypothetical protein AAGF11_41105 [Myxococcota bacterium]
MGATAVLAWGLVACGGPNEASDSGDDDGLGGITLGPSTGASGSGTGDDADDGLGADETTAGVLDVAAEGGIEPTEGCQAVDFLFVIDNSVSMENEQAALVAAFPGFMDAIVGTLEAGSDYHVMVADTDAWGRCDTANGWEGHSPNHGTCDDYIQATSFEECDGVLGAGVVHPAGALASNQPCAPAGGNRYIVEGEPQLEQTFACMATVGTAGHPAERPMDAIVGALGSEINGPGGCNEGFLRDDALLVVTFISDDPNFEDEGQPADWYQAVVDAKLGDPNAVVVLGMTPAWDDCGGNNQAIKGEHWAEFVSMWGERGLHGKVCSTAEEYVAFFEQAVSSIDQACDEYQPPG